MSRILLVANTSWYLYNFRLHLLGELRNSGLEVALVAPHDAYTPLLQAHGFTVHNWLVARSSINPIAEAHALNDLRRIYQREAPDLVHHFTIKACLYGTIAAKLANIPHVINAVTGLGHVFLGRRKRTRALRLALLPLYRAVFSARRSTVVFQNADDLEHLFNLGITDGHRSYLIRSSGVDIDHFSPEAASIPRQPSFHQPVRLLFPSRLIHEKGVRELLSACRALWSQGVDLELLVAGSLDEGNRSSLSPAELEEIRSEARVRCLGHVNEMRAVYASVDLVVLPSYREGLSRALIEAAAMELPIITTDVPGCRDVVDHGISGLLVPAGDADSLRLSIQLLLNNPDLAFRFGLAARQKVLLEFQVSLVNERTLLQYHRLLKQPILSAIVAS
ncbi:MAG: glycosyltransferase family 4 protein [Cyanobacteria bacterium]|nr:glycosyltransferase family 4 protein [Cyanobacteriota bacterium]